MRYRDLGDSGISVSAISLGSWLTYSGGVERDQTEACTRAAFDAGITFFDTANVYGTGAAEEAWGEVLSDYDRESYVLATKVFFPMSDEDRGLSAPQIAKQIDASLARLKTDYVDLYQCHRFDVETPIEETMEALSEVVRSGKARAIGFSEWTPEQIEAGLAVEGAVKFVSSQPQYSALWRTPEAEDSPLCERNCISQIVRSTLGATVNESDVFAAIERGIASGENLSTISRGPITITGVGMSEAFPMGASRRRLEHGDLVNIDLGLNRAGYHGDMARSYAVGELPDGVEPLARACREIQDAAIGAIRPGVAAHAVYDAAAEAKK